ncbi:C45 family autoproteolytic acyltransferase/hydolase [Nocardioides taihuensis]|uniref:C45 family autoproteolytic acyltransferase/hydrolase n=1 Tax=Nocardioides taihuensis TaxID=1835606 RepID=A0ABW0BPS5_9ACTN
MSRAVPYRRIRVSGTAHERGVQYGQQAREEVLHCRTAYEEAFQKSVGWTWAQAVEATSHLVAPVEDAFPQYLDEMRGIAEGTGVTFEDVFTMNARTEVIWAATVRQSEAERAWLARECSAFALLPSRTEDGHTLVGQNWDWLVHSFDSLVVLEVEQPDLPNFVTVVEAGLLAKSTMNSAGLGVAVNALVTSADTAQPGIPFHVLIRAFADCESLSDAVYIASHHVRSSSGNYLIGHADGIAVNLETVPGDYRGITPILPVDDALVHTNHFVRDVPGSRDVAHYAMADSLVRLQLVQRSIAESIAPLTVDALRCALSDHADFPAAVCCHPDPREPRWQQWATVMSVVLDLDARTMYLSDGNPCQNEYRSLTFEGLLDKPSRLAVLREQLEGGSRDIAS